MTELNIERTALHNRNTNNKNHTVIKKMEWYASDLITKILLSEQRYTKAVSVNETSDENGGYEMT